MFVAALRPSLFVPDRLGLVLSYSPTAPGSTFPRSFRQLNAASKEAEINPSIVVIVVILTIIFFLSGCLHLLIRCLVRNPRRDPNSIVTLTALQGQLQQLFHLHDSGVEQAFIDTLPVFFYKSVKGLKEGADCAVCLCEFQGEDRLRLLPKCSHAFHLDCIDTWLLSHSTCPLCRRSLLPDGLALPPLSHEPLLDSSRSSLDGADAGQGNGRSSRSGAATEAEVTCSLPVAGQGVEAVAARVSDTQRDQVLDSKQDAGVEGEGEGLTVVIDDLNQNTGKVMTVKLGRFRIVEANTAGASSSNGSRRSYSVGSYEYVLDPSNLEVVIAATPYRRRSSTPRRIVPGHRTTLSECTPENALPDPIVTPFDEGFCKRGSSPFVLRGRARGEGISEAGGVDEDWTAVDLTSEGVAHDADRADTPVEGQALPLSYKAKQALLYGSHPAAKEAASSSRRAFSFRQPTQDAIKLKVSTSRRSLSETEVSGWEDEERHTSRNGLVSASCQSSNFLSELAVPSFARRTINWLVGKQKRIAHSSGNETSPAGQG